MTDWLHESSARATWRAFAQKETRQLNAFCSNCYEPHEFLDGAGTSTFQPNSILSFRHAAQPFSLTDVFGTVAHDATSFLEITELIGSGRYFQIGFGTGSAHESYVPSNGVFYEYGSIP